MRRGTGGIPERLMPVRRVINALRELVKRLCVWRKQTRVSPRSSTIRGLSPARNELSEPSKVTALGDAGADAPQPSMSDTQSEPPGDHDGSLDERPPEELLNDNQPTESITDPVRNQPESTSACPESSPSTLGRGERSSPISDEIESERTDGLSKFDRSHEDVGQTKSRDEIESERSEVSTPSRGENGQCSPPKTDGLLSEFDRLHEDVGHAKGTGNSRKTKRRPREISGRRNRKPQLLSTPRQSPPSRPELVCRKVHGSRIWEIVLTGGGDCPIQAVHLEGARLDFANQECRVPSLIGSLTVSCRDGQEHEIPLFVDSPLVFKLRKNWNGKGVID